MQSKLFNLLEIIKDDVNCENKYQTENHTMAIFCHRKSHTGWHL